MKEKSDCIFFFLFSVFICKLNKIVLLLQSEVRKDFPQKRK